MKFWRFRQILVAYSEYVYCFCVLGLNFKTIFIAKKWNSVSQICIFFVMLQKYLIALFQICFWWFLIRGQTNSKWFFQADVSSKKRTNKFDFTVLVILLHTPVKSYVVKWPLEKWTCHSHDNVTPLSFHLQVSQVFF